MRICKTLGRGFVRLWERICEDLQDFGRGFLRIHDYLRGIGFRGFMRLWERIHEDLQDFGRGFVRIHETSQDFGRGFVKTWERICETLGEDL